MRADVIYDTLWIHDKGVMDAGSGNAIGGANGPLGRTTDAQIADDFVIEETHRITSVVTDLMAYNDTIPAEGVWVQFYEHDPAGNKPSEAIFAELVVLPRDFVAESIFSPLRFAAWRITIDLTAADIVLEPGRWWINCQPLDIATNGDWFWHIGAVTIPTIEEPSHIRDGGVAHGNGFPGLWGTNTWIPHDFRGNNTLSMRIDGDPLAACDSCDMNCDGVVDAQDIEPFLAMLSLEPRPATHARATPTATAASTRSTSSRS